MKSAYEIEWERWNGQQWLIRDYRRELSRKYAWAVPCEAALAAIESLGPVVEGGAGAGYWASLLRERGVDIVAYDVSPYENQWVCGRWADVLVGGAEQMAAHRDRTLLLVWPPHGERMALDHVLAHAGRNVCYVGEWQGCTGDDAFHAYLEENFNVTRTVEIPRWEGLHDRMWVLTRKEIP